LFGKRQRRCAGKKGGMGYARTVNSYAQKRCGCLKEGEAIEYEKNGFGMVMGSKVFGVGKG
jgi:hypothetical protein